MPKTPFATDISKIDPNMPMRLDVAAKLAFPDGSIGASALRTEAKKGRLVTLRVANKDMTTLAEIEAMKERCRIKPVEPAPRAGLLSGRHPPQISREERFAIASAAALEKIRGLREVPANSEGKRPTAPRRSRRPLG